MDVVNASNNLQDALEECIKSEQILDTIAVKFVDVNPLPNASLTHQQLKAQ